MCLQILGFNAAHLEIYESIYRNVCLFVFGVHIMVQMDVQCMPLSCCFFELWVLYNVHVIFTAFSRNTFVRFVCRYLFQYVVPSHNKSVQLIESIRSICTKHTQVHSDKSHCIDCANFIKPRLCDNKLAQKVKKEQKTEHGTKAARRNATKFADPCVQFHVRDKKNALTSNSWMRICWPTVRNAYVHDSIKHKCSKAPLHVGESNSLNKDNTFASATNISINR